jgi:hypothetical protein
MRGITDEIDLLPTEIAGGDSLRLIDLARRFDVSASTCFRWVVKGLPIGNGERVRLPAIKRGKSWITSEAAVARFFGALPHSTTLPTSTPIRTPSKRQRDSARAAETLRAEYGI